MTDRREMYRKATERDAWWHCTWCGNHEPVIDESYAIGDSEPCALCSEGTAHVMTLEQAANLESEVARGTRKPTRSYSP